MMMDTKRIALISVVAALTCCVFSLLEKNWLEAFAWAACALAYYELHRCWKLLDEVIRTRGECDGE